MELGEGELPRGPAPAAGVLPGAAVLKVGVGLDPGEDEVPGVVAMTPAAVVAEGTPGAGAVAAVVVPAGRSRAPVPASSQWGGSLEHKGLVTTRCVATMNRSPACVRHECNDQKSKKS